MESKVNKAFEIEEKHDEESIKEIDKITTTTAKIENVSRNFKCGYFIWEPECLQKCNNAICAVFWLTLASFLQGAIVSGFTNGSITTLEKRFGISSTEISIVVIMYQVGCIVALCITLFTGSRVHQMRMLASCILIIGLGSFTFAIPHFISGIYNYSSQQNFKCSIDYNDACNDNHGVSKRVVLFLLSLGQFLIGFGSGPLFSITFVYFDQNMSRRKSSLATGIFYGFGILGPALGYVLQGVVLNIYGDFNKVDLNQIDLKANDPRFYGAWWLTFIAGSVLTILNALPVFCFSSYLPNTEKYQERNIQSNLYGKPVYDIIKIMWQEFKTVLSIKSYVLVILADTCNALLVNGLASFAVKFAEIQAYLEPGTASMLTGGIVVFGAGIGSIGGSIILERFNWGCKKIMIFTTIIMILSIVPSFGFFFGCETYDYKEINGPSNCNINCNCSQISFQPICDTDNHFYYISPCQAGCTNEIDGIFSNCKCAKNLNIKLKSFNQCQQSCKYVYALGVVIFIYALLGFASSTPHIQILMRTVPFQLRHLSTSIAWFAGRLLGMIPGPFIFAYILDNACIYWRKTCNNEETCTIFDNKRVRIGFSIVVIVVNVLSAIFMLLATIFYEPERGSDEIDMKTTINININSINQDHIQANSYNNEVINHIESSDM